MAAAKITFPLKPSTEYPGEFTAFRLSLYRVFSACLLEAPSSERLVFFSSPKWMETASTFLGHSFEALGADLPEQADARGLATEYASLFVIGGPSQTWPYESWYREKYLRTSRHRPGRMLGYVALQVQRAYARWSVPGSPDGGDLPDHAGVELGFMSLLVEAEQPAGNGK